jgi:hypothetical protein
VPLHRDSPSAISFYNAFNLNVGIEVYSLELGSADCDSPRSVADFPNIEIPAHDAGMERALIHGQDTRQKKQAGARCDPAAVMTDDGAVVFSFECNRTDQECLTGPENRRDLNYLMTVRPVKTSNWTWLTLGGICSGLTHWLNTEAP